MAKKVILYGDALKLLYTFLDYSEAYPERIAAALYYDQTGFNLRVKALRRQLENGVQLDPEELDEELKALREA